MAGAAMPAASGNALGREATQSVETTLKREGGKDAGASASNPHHQNPKNVAVKEKHIDDLVAKMEKPVAKDPDLSRIIDDLYRENATVGSGSTANALRSEIRTGQPVGSKWHEQKSRNEATYLERWIRKHESRAVPDGQLASPQDIQTAKNLLRDLSNVLHGI